MKQRITEEQLDELTPEQHSELSLWCIKHHNEDTWQRTPRRLNIGEMIEFLDEHNCDIHTCRELPDEARYIRKKHHDYTEVWSKSLNLCDALWEAVKKTLE